MTVHTKEYLKKYKETVEMIAILAEKIGWKIAAKDTDTGAGEPGMIMGKGDYVLHVLSALDLLNEADEDSTECGSEGYLVFENGENPKEEQ
jgi:hypothetical protein